MKTEAGRGAMRALAGEADALIENMAPGKLAELGLGFEDARSANPRIVYCSLSGFGQSGPTATGWGSTRFSRPYRAS